MNDTSVPIRVPHVGRKLVGVVPILLVFSLGFVLGMTSNARFTNFYLPFVPPLPASTTATAPAASSTVADSSKPANGGADGPG